jgi:glycopeptide antibiotics resistance protein
MTLLNRTPSKHEYELRLFWGLRMWLDGEPQGWTVFLQYINNIIFFIPFGFLLSGNVKDWKKVVVIGFCSSAFIELTQYVTARGLAEIDDVISNTLGVVIGVLLWVLMKKGIERYIDVRYIL